MLKYQMEQELETIKSVAELKKRFVHTSPHNIITINICTPLSGVKLLKGNACAVLVMLPHEYRWITVERHTMK